MTFSITLAIIIVTSVVSLICFNNEELREKLIFYPPAVSQRNEWYRFFTCGFIHADFAHLIFNMYALYIFGVGDAVFQTGVEYKFTEIFGEKGRLLYLAMYLLALYVCLIPTYAKNKDNYHYRSLGASGAVSAVVFAQILINPLLPLGLMFIPLFVAGFIFGILYLVISSMLDKKGNSFINHSAHIWGALFGVCFLIVACRIWGQYPILEYFISSIKNMHAGQMFIWGY